MTEEQLPLHKMSDEEIHGIAYELAQALHNKRAAEEEFKSVKKTWNKEISDLNDQIDELSRILKEQEAARRSDA
jgi:uncharacterized protein YukE